MNCASNPKSQGIEGARRIMEVVFFKSKDPDWLLSKIEDKDGALIGSHQVAERPRVRKRDFPWLVYLTFEYEGRPLPTSEEFDQFDSVSKTLEELEKTGEIAHIGIMTFKGKRDFISYC